MQSTKVEKMDRKSQNAEIRRVFCQPEMITEETNVNIKFFESKKGQYWGEDKYNLLRKGIAEIGLDFPKLREKYFPQFCFHEIRLRSAIIFAKYDLTEYFGMKFTSKEIDEEAVKNQETGHSLDKLKHGIYFNK